MKTMKNKEGVVRTIQSTGERPPRHAHISWPIPWRHNAYMMAQYKTVHDANDMITNNDLRECNILNYLLEIQANIPEGYLKVTTSNPHHSPHQFLHAF
jgi:hypothetical protein